MILRLFTALVGAIILACGVVPQALAQAAIMPPGENCFQATAGINGMVGLLGTITAGSGGISGTYGGVALTGGSGSGATANITVSGGGVTAVAILNPGAQYVTGDVLSAASATIGNVTGFSVPISSTSINSALAGGSVGMYIPNTQTFKQTWANPTETILNPNPVPLDANGCATIYGSGQYSQILYDSLGNTVWNKLSQAPNSLTTSPGGTSTEVQFNNAGGFGGDTGFTYFGSGTAFLGLAGTSTGKLGFAGAGLNAGDIILQAPSAATSYNLVLPAAPGTSGQFLQGTVTGSTVTLGWSSGGTGAPGGSSTQVQFNQSGIFGGDTGFTYFGNGAAAIGFAGTSTGTLQFAGATAGDVTFEAAANTGTYNLVLPTTVGTNNYLLQSTVVGQTASLGWVSPTTTVNNVSCTLGSTCTIPLIVGTTTINSGTNGDIEFNNSGVLGEKGVTGSGNVVLATGPTMTSVTISSATSITGLPAPVSASDAATKAYVDATSSGLVVHTAVQWATAAVLPNSPTYSNGSSGVGATLTAGSNAAIVVDGNSPSLNDRVLVKNQSSGLQNGVYTVTTVGSGSAAWVLTRATDFNAITSGFSGGSCTPAASCIAPDSYFFVSGGSVNANSSWVLSNAAASTLTIGTTAITFSQFSSSSTYTAGSNLTLVGTQFSLSTLLSDTTLCNPTGSTAAAQNCTVSQMNTMLGTVTSSGGTINFTGTPTSGQIPIASGASTGAWTTLFTQPINVLSKGADPTGTNDSAAAFNSGLAALATPGACLYIPGGTYKLLSQISYTMPSGPSSLCITGDGPQASVLFWPNTGGGFLIAKSSPAQGLLADGFSLLTQAAGGGIAFNVTQSSPLGAFAQSIVKNVYISSFTNGSTSQYWTTGIKWDEVSGTEVANTVILGPDCSSSCATTTGIIYTGEGVGKEAIYHYLHDSILNGLVTGVSINNYTQGVFMDKLNMQNGQGCAVGSSPTCADILVAGACPSNDDRVEISLFNSQLEATHGGSNIAVECASENYTIIGNDFGVGPTNGESVITINAAASLVQASNNTFLNCGSTGTCVYVNGGGWGNYNNNLFLTASVAINFTVNASLQSAWGNTFQPTVTTQVIDNQPTAVAALPFQSNAALNITANGRTNQIVSKESANFSANIGNTHGVAGDHGIALFGGANGASDSTTIMIDFVSGNASNVLGSITRSGTGLSFNPTGSTTGATCSGLPSASFASVGGIVTHC